MQRRGRECVWVCESVVYVCVCYLATSPPMEPTPAPVKKALLLRLTLAVLLAVAVVRGLLGFLPPSPAHAATPPQALLSRYEAEARAESTAFKGFDAERGRAFYSQPHTVKGKQTSCATCHAEDPTQRGRTPAGKRLEPFALSATADRFTDPANVEKWFGRNCKQVLGRPCTAQEKGDLIIWLATQ